MLHLRAAGGNHSFRAFGFRFFSKRLRATVAPHYNAQQYDVMAFNGVALGERFRLETKEASFANRKSCKNNSGTTPVSGDPIKIANTSAPRNPHKNEIIASKIFVKSGHSLILKLTTCYDSTLSGGETVLLTQSK